MGTHAITGLQQFSHSLSYFPPFSISHNRWNSHSLLQIPFSTPNSNFRPPLSLSTVRATSSIAVGKGSAIVVGQSDLLIVGPGVLGRLVAQQWSEDHVGCQVYGKTATTDHHDELLSIGITPFLKETTLPCQFPYVIFCAPPSKSPDYAGDLSREAASSWNGEGSFVFTSSTAVLDCADNGSCDEETPSVSLGKSPRTDILLKAEEVVLDHGGCILRLAGLYKADRGAHTYWLNQGKSELGPAHIVNLIHYEGLTIHLVKK